MFTNISDGFRGFQYKLNEIGAYFRKTSHEDHADHDQRKTEESVYTISKYNRPTEKAYGRCTVVFIILVGCILLIYSPHLERNYLLVDINMEADNLTNQGAYETSVNETKNTSAIEYQENHYSDMNNDKKKPNLREILVNANGDDISVADANVESYKENRSIQNVANISSPRESYFDAIERMRFFAYDEESTVEGQGSRDSGIKSGPYTDIKSDTNENVNIDPTESVIVENEKVHRLPQCIIIGVRKSGTLALLTFLNMHPDIVTAPKEIHFFGNDKVYTKGLSYYKNRMPPSTDTQITIEKTPSYFREVSTPRRIHDMNNTIKLLLVVREPVHRLISDYAMKRTKAKKANQEYPSLNSLVLDKQGNVKQGYSALLYSTYHVFFKRWLEYFSVDQMHVVDGERLVSDPASELAEIETFLGLRHELTNEKFGYSDSKGFFCKKVNSTLNCLSKTKGRDHPEIEQRVLDKLKEYFQPKNEEFFQMIGKRFDWYT